jgi:predicted GH43/DUF377 family glycosyl hydrolase
MRDPKPAFRTVFPLALNRREFLYWLALPGAGAGPERAVPGDLQTPYKLNRLVVAASKDKDSFDAQFADAPFVFRHGRLFYLTYIGFDGQGYQTGLASSADLIHWKKEGLIIRRNPTSAVTRYNVALTWILRENSVFSPGRLKKVRGRYLGAYHAYPRPGLEEGPAVIGLCWSSDLFHWQLEEPCLRAEDGEPWERGGLYKACLFEHLNTYYLMYNAKNRHGDWHEQSGFASSLDLKHWVRSPGNPLLRNGPPGSADERFASDPCVLRYNGQWAIFYYGLDERGVARDLLALSPDLRQAVKCNGYLVDVGPPGSVDSTYAHKPTVVFDRGVLYHFYCAVSPEHGRGIGLATSRPVGTQ